MVQRSAEPVERQKRRSPLPCPRSVFPRRRQRRPPSAPSGRSPDAAMAPSLSTRLSPPGAAASKNRSAGQRFCAMPDRRVRCLAIGEKPVADHRVAPLQPPSGRGVVPHHHLAQPVGDAPVRRKPGERVGMRRPQLQDRRGHRQQRVQIERTEQNSARPARPPAPAAFPPFPEIAAPESGTLPPSGSGGSPAAKPRGQTRPPRWRRNRAATG